MSIAQGTTHYNYPQVQLNDRPTFADFNPAFEDIDAKLYSLITGASTDHSAIEALQTGLGETNLLLASVKQTADDAKSKADTNAENITLLQTALGNTDRNVANKLDSVAIAEPYDATSGTYSVGDIVVHQGQRYKCTTAVAVAEPFDADKWTGEDVETVLERLATPAAENVTLAPITGMTADDVQEGIAELKSALSDELIATGSGTTYAAQLSSLKTSFDNLTYDQKKCAYLKLANLVANVNNIVGIFGYFGLGATDGNFSSLRLNDSKFYSMAVSNGVITHIDYSSRNISEDMTGNIELHVIH